MPLCLSISSSYLIAWWNPVILEKCLHWEILKLNSLLSPFEVNSRFSGFSELNQYPCIHDQDEPSNWRILAVVWLKEGWAPPDQLAQDKLCMHTSIIFNQDTWKELARCTAALTPYLVIGLMMRMISSFKIYLSYHYTIFFFLHLFFPYLFPIIFFYYIFSFLILIFKCRT